MTYLLFLAFAYTIGKMVDCVEAVKKWIRKCRQKKQNH